MNILKKITDIDKKGLILVAKMAKRKNKSKDGRV